MEHSLVKTLREKEREKKRERSRGSGREGGKAAKKEKPSSLSGPEFKLRTILSLAMIVLFFGIIRLGRLSLIVLIVCIEVVTFSEFVKLSMRKKREKRRRDREGRRGSSSAVEEEAEEFSYTDELPVIGEFISASKMPKPIPPLLLWYCFLTINFMYFRRFLNLSISPFIPFCLNLLWLIWFVLLLRKGQARRQFSQFSMAIMGVVGLAYCTKASFLNLDRGIFWFIFPCLLVIINDISAYLCGKMVGRTPLIDISPNKTVEGFVGGMLLTVFFAVPSCWVCTKIFRVSALLNRNTYLMGSETYTFFEVSFTTRPLYVHAVLLSLFATIFAPFGGFVASGYKRAFKAKNFGMFIPGHGGLTDRMDCQFLMQAFTRVYLLALLREGRRKGVEQFFKEITNALSRAEVERLCKLLGRVCE